MYTLAGKNMKGVLSVHIIYVPTLHTLFYPFIVYAGVCYILVYMARVILYFIFMFKVRRMLLTTSWAMPYNKGEKKKVKY